MITDEAIEAAHKAWREQAAQDGSIFEYSLRAALEAAAPHMLSHEREETRLAHVDAVVNAQTVDRLEKELAATKARVWEEGYGLGYSDHVWSNGHEPRERNPYR